jgi:hypothetical protein
MENLEEPQESTEQATATAAPIVATGPGERIRPPWLKRPWVLASSAALVVALAAGGWMWLRPHPKQAAVTAKPAVSASPQPTVQTDAVLSKNYGNKYANGILPVGDGKYSSSSAKAGSVYVCSQYAQNLSQGGGGASTRGPWFAGTTQWDINKKTAVQGHVNWAPSMNASVTGGKRVITTNDLPSHFTGVFPISSSDPAYAYDRNPNSIKSQSLTYSLAVPASPGQPSCMGGQSGVMLTGVALFNAFDAGGRDAGAWEVQDGCNGHPEKTGEYHYHTLSSCITDASVQTVIGWALDGFPITGPKVGDNNILTTSDLDECHGLTSPINLDGKKVSMYHYVMTQDFPYSVSCFRGTAIQPPGLQQGGGSGGQTGSTQAGPPSGGGTPPPRPLNAPPQG